MSDYSRLMLFLLTWVTSSTVVLFVGWYCQEIRNKPFYFIIMSVCCMYVAYEYLRLYFKEK